MRLTILKVDEILTSAEYYLTQYYQLRDLATRCAERLRADPESAETIAYALSMALNEPLEPIHLQTLTRERAYHDQTARERARQSRKAARRRATRTGQTLPASSLPASSMFSIPDTLSPELEAAYQRALRESPAPNGAFRDDEPPDFTHDPFSE